MNLALLDTDMLSELLRQRNPTVTQRAADCLKTYGQFAISAFTRFEITRAVR